MITVGRLDKEPGIDDAYLGISSARGAFCRCAFCSDHRPHVDTQWLRS